MNLNTLKAIKSRLIEIYNEELLNLNIFLMDLNQLKNNKDLNINVYNRLSNEFPCLDDDDLESLSLFLSLPSFYRRTYQKIVKASIGEEYLENRYQKELTEIEKIVDDDIFGVDSLFDDGSSGVDSLFDGDSSGVDPLFVDESSETGETSRFYDEDDFEDHYGDRSLEIDEDSIIEIAYNHTDPKVRAFALGMVEKSHVWLDFLLNDPDSDVGIAALYYLFGEEYLENFLNYDFYGKIPIEISFNLDYNDVTKDFGIEETVFKKFDRLIISRISNEDDGLIIHTDPFNSYEHAVSEITNQDALKAIANNHNEWSVRYIAVNKIRDLDYLYSIALNGFDKDLKPRHGILYYPGEIGEGDVLKSVLDRIINLRHLNGEDLDEFLKELFYKSKEAIVQRHCLSKIEDDTFLLNLGSDEADPSFARVILDTIKDENHLTIFSLAVLLNPRFDGIHHIFNEDFINSGEMDEDILKDLSEKLGKYDQIDYRNARLDACRTLVSLSREALNKSLKDIIQESGLSILAENHYFRDILLKKIADILIDVAKSDESPSIRSIAVSAIEDKDALREIALEDEDNEVSYNALKNYSDENFTCDYILKYKKDPLYPLRNDLIKDQSILADIAMNDSWGPTREEAVRNLDDEELLEHIAKNDSEWNVRSKAISKIKNKNTLMDIAYKDSDNHVRHMAISRIDDEEVLIDLIYKNDDFHILRDIFSRISNQEIIKDFAYNHSDSNIRAIAVSNITDNSILAGIAMNDEKGMVRKASIMNLVGKFMKVIDKNSDYKDRYFEHIEKRKYFESLIGNDNDWNAVNDGISVNDKNDGNCEYIDPSSIILYEDEKTVTLEDLLVDRAYNDSDEDVSEFAVSYIMDENVLFDIAINDKSTKVRLSAIDGIERNELLARIFVKSKNHHVYSKALSKIRYEYVLRKLAGQKNYYGELWPKGEMANAKLRKLGFKPPMPYRHEDYNNRKSKFFRPVIGVDEVPMELEELLELDRFIKSLRKKENLHDEDDSYDDVDDSFDNSGFPFQRIVF